MPKLDMGLDIQLMVDTINFNLGNALELIACKACVDRSSFFSTVKRCQTCISAPINIQEHRNGRLPFVLSPTVNCSNFPIPLQKSIEMENRESCDEAAIGILYINGSYDTHKGCELEDSCCIEHSNEADAKMNETLFGRDQKDPIGYCIPVVPLRCYRCIKTSKASMIECKILMSQRNDIYNAALEAQNFSKNLQKGCTGNYKVPSQEFFLNGMVLVFSVLKFFHNPKDEYLSFETSET